MGISRSGRRRALGAGMILTCALLPASASRSEPGLSVPQRFFLGTTEGVGKLKIVLHKARATRTRSIGRIDRDGAIILDQTVEQEGEPIQRRQWLLRETAPGRLTGTITDAKGAVTGDIVGNVLHLTYRMKSGEKAEQWVRVAADGQSAQNHMVITKFGLSVATLDEVIRRTGK